MSRESLMSIHTVQKMTVTTTVGASGAIIRTPTNVGDPMLCRVKQLSAAERLEVLQKRGVHASWRIFFYYDPEVEESKTVFSFNDGTTTHLLDVNAVTNPHNMNYFWKVDCDEPRDQT